MITLFAYLFALTPLVIVTLRQKRITEATIRDIKARRPQPELVVSRREVQRSQR